MTARTTAATGFYDDTATWTGGVVPVSGDTITTNHIVTLRDARIIGHSPGAGDAVKAVRCNANLVIANGGFLTVRGDIGLDTGGFYTQAGGGWKFDASLAASPSTALYVCGSINFNAGNGIVSIAGTSANPCTVSSDPGGANGRIKNLEDAQIDAAWVTFSRIGDGSHPAFEGAPENGGEVLRFVNCTFDANCGPIGDAFGVGAAGSAIIELINVTHLGSNSVGIAANAYTSGRRTIKGCHFLGNVNLYNVEGYRITGTTFEDAFDFTSGPFLEWDGNMVAANDTFNDFPAPGLVKNTAVIRVDDPNNPHGFTVSDLTVGFDGLIFDQPDGTDAAGDCITCNQTSSPKVLRVERCIVLPSEGGQSAGTLVSCLGGSNLSVIAEHNTYHGGFGIYVGETYAGFANMIQSAKSNLAWHTSAASAVIILGETGVVQDVVLSGSARNNGVWRASGTGYAGALTFSSGTPGAFDISGDPGFTDSTRNFKKWDLSLGGPGTIAHGLAEMRKRNDLSGFNPAYTIDGYLNYIRTGFVIHNQAMRTGGYDGLNMGAVQAETIIQNISPFPKCPYVSRAA